VAQPRAMSRQEELDDLELDGRTLREWHDWLTRSVSGARSQHPSSSRRRSRSRPLEQRAWLAIALELIYVDAYGADDNVPGALRHYLDFAEHSWGEAEVLVSDYAHRLPVSLKSVLQGPSPN
jgi:hypothetical protein